MQYFYNIKKLHVPLRVCKQIRPSCNGIIRVYSRSIDQYGKTSEWTVETLNLNTSIDTLVLSADNTYYDLQGRKVAYPTRDIYIKNDHKVIVE